MGQLPAKHRAGVGNLRISNAGVRQKQVARLVSKHRERCVAGDQPRGNDRVRILGVLAQRSHIEHRLKAAFRTVFLADVDNEIAIAGAAVAYRKLIGYRARRGGQIQVVVDDQHIVGVIVPREKLLRRQHGVDLPDLREPFGDRARIVSFPGFAERDDRGLALEVSRRDANNRHVRRDRLIDDLNPAVILQADLKGLQRTKAERLIYGHVNPRDDDTPRLGENTHTIDSFARVEVAE